MRKEFYIGTNEDITTFMTRATGILRSVRNNEEAADGKNYCHELSVYEAEELRSYVITLAIQEMERTAGKQNAKRLGFNEDDAEDFVSNFKIAIIEEVDKFNDEKHLDENGKQYKFSTFLRHLSARAITQTYADKHGVSKDVEKKFNAIKNLRKQIASEKQINIDDVSPEMIHAVKNNVSIADIIAILNYTSMTSSVDEMLENDEGVERDVFKGADNVDTPIFDVLDVEVEKVLYGFFNQLTDLEKFFVLVQVCCCNEEYAKMTAEELSVESMVVSIVAADKKLAKNISVGDITISRPKRSSADGNVSIEMKGIEIVNYNVIRYHRRKAANYLKALNESLELDDIVGQCGVKFFRNQWDKLVEKYM